MFLAWTNNQLDFKGSQKGVIEFFGTLCVKNILLLKREHKRTLFSISTAEKIGQNDCQHKSIFLYINYEIYRNHFLALLKSIC